MKIRNLSKVYNKKDGKIVNALNNINLNLPEKGLIFILGKSGSGKTTLLKLLSGLEKPTSGTIIFHNKNISELQEGELNKFRNTYCGFVFQEYNLIQQFNVKDNIVLAAELQGRKVSDDEISNILKEVDLVGFEDRKVFELSGGQQQRVAIARAIIKNPEIIFADEPTGALDKKTGTMIMTLFKSLSKNKLVIVVSHDREFAETFGDSIVEIENGQKIYESNLEKVNNENKVYESIKSKIPANTILKVGSIGLRFYPIRIFVTILILVIVFTFFSISFSLLQDKSDNIIIRSMFKSNLKETIVLKKDINGQVNFLNDIDLNVLSERFGLPVIGLLEDNFDISEIDFKNLTSFYNVSPYAFGFVTDRDIEQYGIELFGRFANNKNEIMITSYTAQQLVLSGYKPEVEKLLDSTITINEEEFIITAIISTDKYTQYIDYIKSNLKSGEKKLYSQFRNIMHSSSYNILYLSTSCYEDVSYSSVLMSLNSAPKNNFFNLCDFNTNNYRYELNNCVVSEAENLIEIIEGFKPFISILTILIGVFALLITFYFISQSIEDKATTIAILKCLGASNNNVINIFLWEELVLSFLITVVSLIFNCVFCIMMNFIASSSLIFKLSIFNLNFIDALVVSSSIIISCVLSGLLSITKIYKINVFKLIK